MEREEASASMLSNGMSPAETPQYLPPSMLSKRLSWDVFLSFRGEDTRRTITEKLRSALQSNGVRTFMDDEGMQRGDVIQPSLEEAIVDSALAIAVISPRYADSRWCLHELSRIFECRKRVLPIFYRVDPSDVRRQRGDFGEGFAQLADSGKVEKSVVKRWADALNQAGNISGYPCYHESDEPELVRRIVKQVLGELKNTPEYVVKLDVGLDSRVGGVLERLDIHSDDVRFLGIHGTPGIGKTTLAKAVFNKLAAKFKNRCFVSNVRETLSTRDGILSIQNKLISDLSTGRASVVEEVDAAKRAIKLIVSESQVLIVLDDVSEAGQLEELGLHNKEWFERGSRIIITTRNIESVLHFAPRDGLYEAQKLDESESMELFSIHALGRREPTQEYQDVSKQIVSLTDGLPLALEVFGSYLVKRPKKEWEDSIKKLRHLRPHNLQDVLKFSYDGLDEQEKIIFLDISCLLLQTDLNKVELVDILEGCGLRAEVGIGNLVTKSLLKIKEDNKLWMHDQIRDMGRQIVIEQSLEDLGKRSRLWDLRDILSVLHHSKVADCVRGIVMQAKKPSDFTNSMLSWYTFQKHPNPTTAIRYLKEKLKELWWHRADDGEMTILSTTLFDKMVNLKLLQINYVQLRGDFKHMPADLRWLGWRGCPHRSVPVNLPEEIRVLDLSGSGIEDFGSSRWPSPCFTRMAGNMVVMNLSGCGKLTTLPDMSGYQHLKKLILENCGKLTKLHDSIGSMSSLVYLNLRNCVNLVGFPSDVTGMKGLSELILSSCVKFTGLPDDVRSMKSLTKLLIDNTAIMELPKHLYHLTQLEVLSLNHCKRIRALPEWLGKLTSLKELYVDDTSVVELPNSVGSLANLEKLSLRHCALLTTLPESMGNLGSLVELYLSASSIQQLPASIGSLSFLRILSLERCRSVSTLPLSMEGLASLMVLVLDHTSITELSDHICSLKFVKKLWMTGCTSLKRLSLSLGNMSNLTELIIVGAAITQLPDSIGELGNLTLLNLNQCRELCSLPNSFPNLRSLKTLRMQETAVTSLPENFGSLQSLEVLKMNKPLPSRTQAPPSNLNHGLPGPSVLPTSFSNLSALEIFEAPACRIIGKIPDEFARLSKIENLNLSYNDFHSLPSSMEGLSVLKKLMLWHCENLRSLPRLPSALMELNAADCYALENISDLSTLERLQELQLANCYRIKDVPGLECLKSLRRLYMGGCNADASAVRNRLSKAALKNLSTLSIPGSTIPEWFSRRPVSFAGHSNLSVKSVIVGVIVSVDMNVLDDVQSHLPSIVDIQARIIRQYDHIFKTVLILHGVPITQDDQLYLCRFKYYHPLVLLLREGDIIELGWRTGPVNGIELKKWGIYLVYENDDDYDGEEDSLEENQWSVSQKLVHFFRSMEQTQQS